jgi:hypothetical protein
VRLHINRPRGHYIGQVRKAGHRLWNDVTVTHVSAEYALLDVAAKMEGMKRGRVLFIDEDGYYEPNVVFEVSRA